MPGCTGDVLTEVDGVGKGDITGAAGVVPVGRGDPAATVVATGVKDVGAVTEEVFSCPLTMGTAGGGFGNTGGWIAGRTI